MHAVRCAPWCAPQKEAEAHHEIVEMALPSHTTIADLKRRIYETDIHGQRVIPDLSGDSENCGSWAS